MTEKEKQVIDAAIAYSDFIRTDQKWIESPPHEQLNTVRASLFDYHRLREALHKAVDDLKIERWK